MKALFCCVAALASVVNVVAQSSDAIDPIRCWWRTSNGAVAIGESFEATLTCAVRDQESVRTVTDESRLPAATIQLAPFEVLSGTHPGDLRSPTHRFFQYHYTLRVIDRDAIGRDLTFPDLRIAFRVHTKSNGEWVEGRERTYVMPGRPVRVLSLVPAAADDIRDSSDEGFARVAGLRFRATALKVTAIALLLVGALVAVPAVASLARRGKAADASVRPRAPRRAVLATIDRELDAIAQDARGGWTADLAARALNALRLAAACALNRDVAAQPVNETTAGWLVTTTGVVRRRRLAISSAVTSLDLRTAIDGASTVPHVRQQLLEQLAEAMEMLTSALYGARFNPQHDGLDEAVTSGRAAARDLRRR
jgi:hypothetical protein